MTSKMEVMEYAEEYIMTCRGLRLFTCRWLPKIDPKALVFLCHGYAMECSISMRDTGLRLANAGFAVYGMDYQGHGKSSGLAGYVQNFDDLVDDCANYYTDVCEKEKYREKKRILMGESMGGAVALLLHRKKPKFWDGAILVAPMCKIADDMRPNPVVVNVLSKLCDVIPTWRIIPTQDIIDNAFRLPKVREEIRSNTYCYKGRPRLRTGYHLLTVSLDLERNLHEVSLPFIVLHGAGDTIVDPKVSKLLYEKARSTDKTFKLYPEMWHSLTYGELPENIDIVFSDVIDWLNERTTSDNSRSEKQQKLDNDKELKNDSPTMCILPNR